VNYADKAFWTEAEAAEVERTGLQTLLKAVAIEVPFSGELNEIWLEPGRTSVPAPQVTAQGAPAGAPRHV